MGKGGKSEVEEVEDAFDEVSCQEEEVKRISFLSVHLLRVLLYAVRLSSVKVHACSGCHYHCQGSTRCRSPLLRPQRERGQGREE